MKGAFGEWLLYDWELLEGEVMVLSNPRATHWTEVRCVDRCGLPMVTTGRTVRRAIEIETEARSPLQFAAALNSRWLGLLDLSLPVP